MAGGGVGEAMLISAAVGGGMSALRGGDPLKGALLGGLTAGALGGLGSAVSSGAASTGSAAASTGAASAGTAPVAGALEQAAQQSAGALGAQTGGVGLTGAAPSMGISGLSPAATGLNPAAIASPSGFAGQMGPLGVNVSDAATASFAPMAKPAMSPFEALKANPIGYFKEKPLERLVAPAAAGYMAGAGKVPGLDEDEEKYRGPLSWFKYDPRNFQRGWAEGGITSLAKGGISSLGSYSDGGRMLKGPGDGMSDSIPASIANKRPARLADNEFVVPADVVSHLGNGSSDAGARQLYAMMDRVRKARTGTKKQGKQINPQKFVPA